MLHLLHAFGSLFVPPNTETEHSITFTVPAEHPAAMSLELLFERLCTFVKYDSGLEVQYGPPDDEAAAEFLAALKKVVEDCGVDFDSAMERFAGQQVRSDCESVRALLQSKVFGRILQTSLEIPFVREDIPSEVKARLGNVAEDMLKE